MPIGKSTKSSRPKGPLISESSTGFIASRPPADAPVVVIPSASDDESALPSYTESESSSGIPCTLIQPSSEHDLEYFGAIASGKPASVPPYSTTLTLNFYRNTRTHISPVAEAITLGSSSKSHFFGLQAVISPEAPDEYNRLLILRRQPQLGMLQKVARAEIYPRLKLTAPGTMPICQFFLGDNANTFQLIWDGDQAMYIVYSGSEYILDVELVEWTSLDEQPMKGKLLVSGLR
jgi:hypothetical protein